MTENKRFIDNGHEAIEDQSFTDTKTDKTYYVDYFDEIIDLTNRLNEENEQLKQVLGSILLEVRKDITNTSCTGEIKVFIHPNSFDLISNVLRKYGALKEWYE